MDLISTIIGTALGSVLVIFATKWIEKSKLSAVSETYLDCLYLELEDVLNYSKRTISIVYPLHCKLNALQANCFDHDEIQPFLFPRGYPADWLPKHYENCMLKLSLEQRYALKTVYLYLEECNQLITIIQDKKQNLQSIDITTIHNLLSTMCCINHLASDMVHQKKRLKINDRSGEEIYHLVLKQHGFDSSAEGMWDFVQLRV